MGDRIIPIFLFIAFAMLWLPIGQHTFLFVHWMKVGTFMAPFLLLIAFSFSFEIEWRSNPRTLSLFLLVAYLIHQFEEHWVDVYGRTYAFKSYLNGFLSGILQRTDQYEFISDASIFVINTSLVWLVGSLAIWRGSRHVFVALCMASIVTVNAVSHIAVGIAGRGYNPGLLTSIILFLPLGLAVYVWIVRSGAATLRLVLASIIWALLAHIIMIGGIVLMSQFQLRWEAFYFIVLVVWSIVPILLFRPSSIAKEDYAS